MKLEPRQFAEFLREPGAVRLALIIGEDDGLIRERGQALTRRIAGSLDDPFRVTELTRDGWGRIPAEMAALSLIGGRRVVLVRDATDAVLPRVVEAMRVPGTTMLILEAAGLPKGKLRSFAEASPESVAFACHVAEGRAVVGLARAMLAELSVTADDEAMSWLAQNLEPGHSAARGEMEKLALFVGSPGHLTLEAAQACVDGQSAGAGDEGLMAAVLGHCAAADGAIELVIADGLGGVGVIRMALSLLQRLHQAKLRMEAGESATEIVRLMRPPVFRRAVPAMVGALNLWSASGLLRCIEHARRVELDCKQTASRPDLLARRFVADLARAARLQSRYTPTAGVD